MPTTVAVDGDEANALLKHQDEGTNETHEEERERLLKEFVEQDPGMYTRHDIKMSREFSRHDAAISAIETRDDCICRVRRARKEINDLLGPIQLSDDERIEVDHLNFLAQ